MRRLTHLIVLMAFAFSCGGHWAIFQGIAWANMIREYSEVVPVAQAVQMTFSGQYPCSICKALAEKKSSEQQKAFSFEKVDKKFLPPMIAPLAERSVASADYPRAAAQLHFISGSPSVPPPRAELS